jgi:hypothetical protein
MQNDFLKFARKHCCNYGAKGGLDYCWALSNPCLLAAGSNESCKWFVEAVLPQDRDLEAQWHRLRGASTPWAKRERTCACGKRFRFTNSRQLRYDECGKAHRREQIRKRVRRHRAK